MKKSISWVKAVRLYNDKTPAELIPFCNTFSKQFTLDPDVPVSAITPPLTLAIYNSQINDVNTDEMLRQNSNSPNLTADEHSKVGILLHSTDTLTGVIESVANQKYPGDAEKIGGIFARFGLTATTHGIAQKHIFNILSVAAGSATLQAPSNGQGANYHWRWSVDQKMWTQVKSTHKGTVTLINLPMDVRVYFQFDVSLPVGRGVYPQVSAKGDDFSWSDSVSEMIPA